MDTLAIVWFLAISVFVLLVRTPKKKDGYHDTVVEFRNGMLVEVLK